MLSAVRMSRADDVGGGAAALLRPLVDAGFRADQVGMDADLAKQHFLLEQKRLRLQNQPVIPQARKRSYLRYIFIGIAMVIALIALMATLASSTAARSSRTGIVAEGLASDGKRKRVIRRRRKP